MATVEEYYLKHDPNDSTARRKAKRYKVQYRTPDRKPTTKRGFTTKGAAQKFAAEVEVSKSDGSFIDPAAGRITVAELHPSWEHAQKQLALRSQRNNRSAWNVHVNPKWGGWPVNKITTPAIREWVVTMQETNKRDTVLRGIHVLRSILDVAVEQRRIRTNPAVDIKVKRELRPKRPYLTVDQVDTLAAGMAGDGNRTMIYLMAYCGPRINEVTALDVADYDHASRRLSITKAVKGPGEIGPTKTFEQRRVPVPQFVADKLREHTKGRDQAAPLFTSPEGHRIDSDNWRDRTFKPGLKVAQAAWKVGNEDAPDLPTLTPHSLRHTCASLAISAGANVMAVQKMLGHEDASVTLRTYADLFPDDLDQVATVLDALRDASIQKRLQSKSSHGDRENAEGPE